ncbi:PTS sugar transporter subunit IIC [Lacticaseibacillus parakribbianus]|uniref:PTS sugar transporter subunit IIC n=1 Tax=Lacticaseibacillus parakribbianus TaxID=2970927 RepID=UPI0021CB0547|nr:PTS sugar transporter subunit IIC [Lacticaseibacillus parakribbianus]
MNELKQYKPGDFWQRLLSAVAMAIVVGVTPSAIVSPFISGLASTSPFWAAISTATSLCQFSVPLAAGILAATRFNLTMVESASVGLAAMIGSGAIAVKNGTFTLVGMGDLINTIIIIALTIVVMFLIRKRVGSFALIVDSIVGGSLMGAFGTWSYPYVHMISTWIGKLLNTFTDLQPVLMCLLLGTAFAVLIVTPISTIALGYAIGLSGLAGGTPSVAITACFMFVGIATYKTNGIGLSIAMFFGSVKMMLANFVKHPRMMIPIAVVGAIGGLTNALLFKITAVAQFSGFGQPVAAIHAYATVGGSALVKLLVVALAYYILPLVYCLIVWALFKKFLPNIYNEADWKVDLSK